MHMTGNTILITGGGSGIGAALAHRFHALGNTVIIAGRRLETLEAVIGDRPSMHALPLDMESPDDIARFAETLIRDFPSTNVIINNAGIMRFEALDRARNLADAEAMITTNLLGPIRLIDALVEHLAGQENAAIVNVTSGLAFVPLVSTPTYSATKAALHSYTQSLRAALADKIEVIELAPPAVQTELTPGQSTREGYLPLEAFIDEVMDLFAVKPTPAEILVNRVNFLRKAEAANRFDQTFSALNSATH